jgi:hypothetical protein
MATAAIRLRGAVRRAQGAGHLGITGVNSLRLRLIGIAPTPGTATVPDAGATVSPTKDLQQES